MNILWYCWFWWNWWIIHYRWFFSGFTGKFPETFFWRNGLGKYPQKRIARFSTLKCALGLSKSLWRLTAHHLRKVLWIVQISMINIEKVSLFRMWIAVLSARPKQKQISIKSGVDFDLDIFQLRHKSTIRMISVWILRLETSLENHKSKHSWMCVGFYSAERYYCIKLENVWTA